MIDEIHVHNVALIRDAKLIPSQGLTVITGETGSGKTALLSALKLLSGERADVTALREGADALTVEGRLFDANDPSAESIVVRRVGKDGRSRITLNGTMASVGELSARVGSTIDLCGQHEHQKLLKASNHVGMLDSWATETIKGPLEDYISAFKHAKEAAEELGRVREASKASAGKLDEARFILARIDEVNPEEGEYEDLIASLSKTENAEGLAVAANTTHTALSGEGGAIEAIQLAATALESVAGIDNVLADYAANLRESTYVLEDISRDALTYRDSIEYDSDTLSSNQERMALLQNLMRTYGPRMEDVMERREEASELVSLVDDFKSREAEALQLVEEKELALHLAAEQLDAVREEAAPRFAASVNAQMNRLEMSGASIVCEIKPLEREEWTQLGSSRIEFLFQPTEGLSARPLARIASGGEVSRVMLAIKVVLGESDEVDTLVFDEVDAGVGGTTAVALAQVLADLALTHQVIVVTHLAQVAVKGDTHYAVAKRAGAHDNDHVLETDLFPLTGESRAEEIARMLSGDATTTSLEHAKEMLERAKA